MIQVPALRSILEYHQAIERRWGDFINALNRLHVQDESSKHKEKSKCQIKMERSTGKRSW